MKIGDKEFKLEPDLESTCSGCHFLTSAGGCSYRGPVDHCFEDGKPMILVEVVK